MQYVSLAVPQHIYEQLGLHPNKTLVLKRSENICGLDTHGKNVSSSESAEPSSHCDEPLLAAPEIDDACEEIESSLLTQDGTLQAIHGKPDCGRYRNVRISYPRACENCNQKYFTASSYFSHLERCRFIPRIQKTSYLDSSGWNMIPEAFHALGYDAPVLAEPEINDTPEQNKSSEIIGSGMDIERCQDSSADFNMIPEALHALCYDASILSEPEINDGSEENDSSLQKFGGTSRVFLNPSNIDSPILSEPEINDAAEENDSSLQKFGGTSRVFLNPSNIDTPILSEPEINDAAEENDSSLQKFNGASRVFLNPSNIDTPILLEPGINDATEKNDSSLQKFDGTSRVFLNPSNINDDAEETSYRKIKAVFPRPCPLCEKMCNAKSTYYQHRKICVSTERASSFRKKKVPNFDDPFLTNAELRVLGYDITVDGEIESFSQMDDDTYEEKDLNPSDADEGIENIKITYPRPCPICDKMCNSTSIYFKHRRRCRAIEIPKNSSVIRYYDYGSSSDSADHLDVTPKELGGDPPVLAESGFNKSNEGTANQSSSEIRNAFQGMKRNTHGVVRWRRKLYPRVCAKCRHKYRCKDSFYAHKKYCARLVATDGRSRCGVQNITFEGRCVSFVYVPEPGMNKMSEGEASNAGNNVKLSHRTFCLACRHVYSNKFGFMRHLKSCGRTRIGPIKRVRIGDYVLPPSARRYHEQRQDKLMSASDKEDKPVNWVPVTTKPTNVLKYFVANKNSS